MKRKLFVLFLTTFLFAVAYSQSRQVTGHVSKQNSTEDLAGISVTVKGTNTATTTDKSGAFTINIPDRNNVVLVISSVGFRAQEVNVGTRSSVDVELQTEASTLNDVVVVGYSSVRRRDLTGSVSSVSAKQLKDVPLSNAAEALTGRLAGVQVTTAEGAPGASVVIRIRGGGSITQDNSPIYIVDGIQVENALNVISPQDIASVDVLKDASTTAIYGARGANGVVIITTKSGRSGKTIISYNGSVGFRQIFKKMDVLHPYEFVVAQWERSRLGAATDIETFNKTY